MKPHSFVMPMIALSLLAARPLDAATDDSLSLQRCVASDGTAIYTDKPCARMGAKSTPMSGELLTRIVMDGGDVVTTLPGDASMGAYRDASEPLAASYPGRRAQSSGCARSPDQLTQDLMGSFAVHDVNRVAESYHWVGMSHRQSLPVMKQLERLSGQPLSDAQFLAAWIGSGDLSPEQIPSDAGLMQLVFAGGDARVIDFEVRRYSGCYFISF